MFIQKPKEKDLLSNLQYLNWLLSIWKGEKHYRSDNTLITPDDALFSLTSELWEHKEEILKALNDYYNELIWVSGDKSK